MPAHSLDEALLHRALELAHQSIGMASPNPYVGAIIADPHGNVVGTATYTYAGVKHAEVLALEAAGNKARGATLYINLEPHAHQGRTPPCTDVLIAAGIHRVVAAMPDPNPKVSGKGFEKLRAAGVHVEVGRLEEQARRLNEAFARYIRHGTPLVTLKAAMTLDGKIAPPPPDRGHDTSAGGFSRNWITGEPARAHVQELRHQNDALLVGVGTVLSDNPLLTDRSGRARRRPLLRVILDSHLRLPLGSRIVQSAAAERSNDVLVFCLSADAHKKQQLEQLGIRIENISARDPGGHPDLQAILHRLGQLEIASLMIEGGANINATAFASSVVDKVFLYYASKILAGADSISLAAGAGFRDMSQAAQVTNVHLHRFGEDFAVEGYLRDPYGE
ncbi:MAG TPA: bifunctional diaminohydroxyphosphoribosylaminopyrimidine deaminase/5-amino-6-(5-phosphoribosylamino)uracil reductase RibD [Candidatus Sulfotelmatobacter sp.]|nr:bifunctional diaminohydroxyphosphoribosylaminopyrimidine deaminase/5-amino-6-(5-phosphoribosylamino)uracil reductase RibD [Candidatus Sulfotelmatobacter sp.]